MLSKFLIPKNLAWVLLLLMPGLPAFAATYKWVDENGVTHYGDSIPPEYRDRANTEMNKEGVILRKNAPALTPEQLKAKEAELVKRRQEAEEKRKDSTLMRTYTSVEEIDLARDRNLQQIELVIENFQTQLKTLQADLDASRKRAKAYALNDQPVPEQLQEDIEYMERIKQNAEVAILQKRAEAKEIRARFEEDKKRYIELTQNAPDSKK
ncbi:MAG TPA: DUF4124 domain-containing protein [Burkholderiales bacterium]|nr:DUF4124 domain-containing protein [Burkholderiales bacterium]